MKKINNDMNYSNDFQKYASLDRGISPMTLSSYRAGFTSCLSPTIIEERKKNVAHLDVFSRLLMDRIIFIGVRIDDEVANIVQAQLLYLSSIDPKTDISLYLNTPGGLVSAGLGIYDTMNLVSPDIRTICTGRAASMGAVLLCSGTNGKRLVLPHSRILIHQPLGGAEGQASDIIIAAREIEKCRETLCGIISCNTGQDYDKVLTDIDRDYWMSAQEAKEYGMVDEILANHNEQTLGY